MHFHKKFLLLMGIVCICTANEYTQSRHLPVRNNRSSSVASLNEMMTQIYDRVSVLVTLDQAQRDKLDAIGNKLMQLDASTSAGLSSIQVQQQQTAKQLEDLDYAQRNVQSVVGEILNKMDVMRYAMDQKKGDVAQSQSHVRVRQAVASANDTEGISNKLDALATFLTSTRVSVSQLENTLANFGASLTKLTQLTRGTHRRLSTLSNRAPYYTGAAGHPQSQYSNAFNTYGPPPVYPIHPISCAQASLAETGIQKIQLAPQTEPFYAYCESAYNGGWTVILNRFDGSINFNRDWNEYKLGFGNLAGEFFIGLDKLNAITADSLQELMIVMVDFKNESRVAHYTSFAIGGEKEFYPLQILGEYSGTAGDSFSSQAGNKFSTFDNDNDGWVEGNCAQQHTGAWWYAACETSNLNGQYLEGEVDATKQYKGMYWDKFHGPLYSLKSVQMKIRPIETKDAL